MYLVYLHGIIPSNCVCGFTCSSFLFPPLRILNFSRDMNLAYILHLIRSHFIYFMHFNPSLALWTLPSVWSCHCILFLILIYPIIFLTKKWFYFWQFPHLVSSFPLIHFLMHQKRPSKTCIWWHNSQFNPIVF